MAKASSFENLLTVAVGSVVVAAISSTCTWWMGMMGQAFVAIVLIMSAQTSMLSQLSSTWSNLQNEVKLGLIAFTTLCCFFSVILRVVLGGVIILRTVVLLGLLSIEMDSKTNPITISSLSGASEQQNVESQPRNPNVSLPSSRISGSQSVPTNGETQRYRASKFSDSIPQQSVLEPRNRKLESVSANVHHEVIKSPLPSYRSQSSVPQPAATEGLRQFAESIDMAVEELMEVQERAPKHLLDESVDEPFQLHKRPKTFTTQYHSAVVEDDSLMKAVLSKRARVENKENRGDDEQRSAFLRPVLKRKTVNTRKLAHDNNLCHLCILPFFFILAS